METVPSLRDNIQAEVMVEPLLQTVGALNDKHTRLTLLSCSEAFRDYVLHFLSSADTQKQKHSRFLEHICAVCVSVVDSSFL